MSAEATCAVCGRTILAGERVHGFVEGSEESTVCELCVVRAERLGWRPAGAPEPERAEGGHERRWRLQGLLRSRSRRKGAAATVDRFQNRGPYRDANGGNDEVEEAAPAKMQTRPVHALDPAAPSPFERAVARFNSSEAGRTVAGLTRTLGIPFASVGAAAGAPDEVRITVAWELSWYQWGVDIGDELRPVFQIDKGREIDQLDAAARQWNASVGEEGRIALAESVSGR